ncbi:MAG TPA: ABC transporter permease [Candidatus Acidoferrum sp.]|nr:ABC transporter permease [Candidatus Acidoferrum sp.]
MGHLWQNLSYALRVLPKSRGFTSVAVLSLALGIGANTAIFTLINALLLRDVPVRQPERLVEVSPVRCENARITADLSRASCSQFDRKIFLSYPMYRELERQQRVFSAVIGWSSGFDVARVEVNGAVSQNEVFAVSGNYHNELGATPLLGRLLTPEDEDPRGGSTLQVAVLGYEFWQSRFGGAPDVVGKQIRIEGTPFTIIGVTRKWFTGLTTGDPPEITVPITAQPLVDPVVFKSIDDRSLLWVMVTGRLKNGVTIDQAHTQLQSFWPDLLAATASVPTPGLRRQRFLSMGLDVSAARTGVAPELRAQFTRPLYLLLGIVGLILLAACVNLANLMLARAAARAQEMSMRVALGAGRWQLMGQVLTESLALPLGGAFLGIGFAYWGSNVLVTLMTEGALTRVTLDLRPDLRVLGITMAAAILTGVLFGLAPAWRSARQDPAAVLEHNARSLAGGGNRLSQALIVAQVSLSLILLLGAGLLLKSFQKLHSLDLGFASDRLLEVSVHGRPDGHAKADARAYHQQLIERITRLPGVRAVGFAADFLPSREGWHDAVSVATSDWSRASDAMADTALVSPDFFRTMGIALLRGREFDWADDEGHPLIAIVSESLAQRLFPKGDAIGQRIRFGVMADLQMLEIVGVAADARIFRLREAAAPVLYIPCLQHPNWADWTFFTVFVRTKEDPESVATGVRKEIESLGQEYVVSTKTVEQVTGELLVSERVNAMLCSFFAGLALLLASIGLYGLMSYSVTRRTREIGVRVALGAQQRSVRWMILRETLALTLLGIAIGVLLGLAATRLIASMLFGLSPNDLSTIVTACLLLLTVALFAGYVPARKASSIDPMSALRTE